MVPQREAASSIRSTLYLSPVLLTNDLTSLLNTRNCIRKYKAEAGNSTLHTGETRQYNANFHKYNYGVLEDWPQLGQFVAPEPAQLEVDREL